MCILIIDFSFSVVSSTSTPNATQRASTGRRVSEKREKRVRSELASDGSADQRPLKRQLSFVEDGTTADSDLGEAAMPLSRGANYSRLDCTLNYTSGVDLDINEHETEEGEVFSCDASTDAILEEPLTPSSLLPATFNSSHAFDEELTKIFSQYGPDGIVELGNIGKVSIRRMFELLADSAVAFVPPYGKFLFSFDFFLFQLQFPTPSASLNRPKVPPLSVNPLSSSPLSLI